MCKNYGKGEKWLLGVILMILSPVTYLVSINGFGVRKRHINKIIERIESEDRVLVVPSLEKARSNIGNSEVGGEKDEDLQNSEGELIDEEIAMEKELLEPTSTIRRSARAVTP